MGPLEISDGGEFRRLGAAKQRALLAALIVGGGKSVSVDWLVEQLWGGRAPASAENLIQGYVRALRRALGDPGGESLRTQASGYQLVLSDDQLDLRCFESLVDRGRKALDDGDSRAASDILTEAQQMWRGQPFIDVPLTSAVAGEAHRLEQLWLTALEGRIDADLDLGRHSALVPELCTLTKAHPLMERFWEQLMLALYRSGRQAEALAAYQRLHRLLDDELGVEPTRPVRTLHQRILASDAALDTLAPQAKRVDSVAGSRQILPRQLPADVSGFAGRREQLSRLDALLPDNETALPPTVVISVIAGAAGIGKTTLAVHWAHRVANRFPDGQLYVNLRGFDPSGQPVRPDEAIRGFLELLGVAPERMPVIAEARAAMYRSLVADTRTLVLLDNAANEEQVRPLLPASAGCLVLITSRNQLSGLVAAQGARPVGLGMFSNAEAREMLARRLGQDRVDAERQAVGDIIAVCAGLPLALAIVAARGATHPGFPLHSLATQLREARTSLVPFTGPDDATDLPAVFSWSYHQLSADAKHLFRLLGSHPGPDLGSHAAASLAGQPFQRIGTLLDELVQTQLVAEHKSGRFLLHDLLRTHARELAQTCDADCDRHAAVRRIVEHYLYTAYAAAVRLDPHREIPTICSPRPGVAPEPIADAHSALSWFDAERAVLPNVTRLAASAGLDSHVWQLAWCTADFYNRRGHWPDMIAAGQRAVHAARRQNNKHAQAQAHRGLGRAYVRMGSYDQAQEHLRTALDLSASINDLAGQGRALQNLALVLAHQGSQAEALDCERRAVEVFRATNLPAAEANALNAVGWTLGQLGDYRGGLDACRQALALQQELDDPYGQAETLDSIGYLHHQLGDFRMAIARFQEALVLFEQLGQRYWTADTLTHLGNSQHAIGDHRSARQNWRSALHILEELHHPDARHVRTKLALRG